MPARELAASSVATSLRRSSYRSRRIAAGDATVVTQRYDCSQVLKAPPSAIDGGRMCVAAMQATLERLEAVTVGTTQSEW